MKPTELSVLVVDDDKNIRTTLTASLKTIGYAADACDSVGAAVARLKAKSYDVVITDFRMEKETGLDLIRQAKVTRPDAFLIVMTAYASKSECSIGRKGGSLRLPAQTLLDPATPTRFKSPHSFHPTSPRK